MTAYCRYSEGCERLVVSLLGPSGLKSGLVPFRGFQVTVVAIGRKSETPFAPCVALEESDLPLNFLRTGVEP